MQETQDELKYIFQALSNLAGQNHRHLVHADNCGYDDRDGVPRDEFAQKI